MYHLSSGHINKAVESFYEGCLITSCELHHKHEICSKMCLIPTLRYKSLLGHKYDYQDMINKLEIYYNEFDTP